MTDSPAESPGPVPEDMPGPAGPVPAWSPGPVPEDAGTAGTTVPGPARTSRGPATVKLLMSFSWRQAKRALNAARERGVIKLARTGIRRLRAARPGSYDYHEARIRSLAWVPHTFTGDEKFIVWVQRVRVFTHCTLGRFLKVTGNSISAVGDKFRRMAWAGVILLVLVILFFVFA
jgi:hypothetical protein